MGATNSSNRLWALVVSAGIGCGSPVTGEGKGAAQVGDSAAPAGDGADGGGADGGGDGGSAGGDGASDTVHTGDTGEPPGPEPFELVVQTTLTSSGTLALHTNLPPATGDCLALDAADPPCVDDDLDGLVDAWEELVLARMSPLLVLDEAEPALDDADWVLAGVGRVTVAADDPERIRAFIMLGWSRDYGRCGVSAHDGDSERVALDLAPLAEGGAGGVVVVQAYTAAHEGTVLDHGHVFADDELAELETTGDPITGEPRWQVYVSEGKHATYGSVLRCESVSPIPCVDEDCAPDGVDDRSPYLRTLPVVNAGEPGATLVDDLAEIGFPDESAWADQPFCGGQGRGGTCSSAVREKLVNDPF